MTKLTKEEIDYLIRRLTFTYKNATVTSAIERCKSIIDKLEEMKKEVKENGN